jgi:hypothetical protein
MSITNVNELWGRKWRFKDDTSIPNEFSLRNSVTGVKFATFYLGEEARDVYQTDNSVGNVGITTQGTFIRIGVSESSFTYAYAASGWVGKPAILEFVENTNNYTLSCTNEENFITWFNENATEYVPPLNEWAEGVANKVRKLTGKTDKFKLLNLEKELDNISTGIDTSDATATPNDMLLGKTAYVNSEKIEGTIETWNGETNSDVNVENVVSVNGLIEEYKVLAGENVNAGDFVDFVNNKFTELDSKLVGSQSAPMMFQLNENRVIIIYNVNAGLVNNTGLYGVIVDFDEKNITVTFQLIDKSESYYTYASGTKLSPNRVFITYAKVSDKYAVGLLIDIDGTTITTTKQTINETKDIYYGQTDCLLIEENKVFVVHSKTMNSEYLCGTIVNIDGTTMTATTTILNSSSYSYRQGGSCVLLEPNKVFIAHGYNYYDSYLYGTVVTIDGDTLTATTTKLDETRYSCYRQPKSIMLSPTKVFIAHSYSTDYILYGTMVTINGTSLTRKTQQLFSNLPSFSCYGVPACVLLEDNKIFIAHAYGKNRILYGTTVVINGTNMETESSVKINDQFYDSTGERLGITLLNNKVIIAHNFQLGKDYSGKLAITMYPENNVKLATDTIKGIAKTSGTGGETIQVFVPNTGV